MSDDIVDRLRLRPTILRKNQFGDMETDRAATALFDDCHAIMREAADEIEDLMFRLQVTIGELDNALSRERTLLSEQEDLRIGSDNLHAEIERLREELNTRIAMCDMRSEKIIELTDEIERLRTERDEARRIVCCQSLPSDYTEWNPSAVDSALRLIAAQQGWKCFKEDIDE